MISEGQDDVVVTSFNVQSVIQLTHRSLKDASVPYNKRNIALPVNLFETRQKLNTNDKKMITT